MAKLSDYIGKPAGQSPLPTFGIWSYSPSSLAIYDSDFTPISIGGLSTSTLISEAYIQNSGLYQTNSQIGTAAATTYWVNATINNGFDGHHLLNANLGDGGLPYNPNSTFAKAAIARPYLLSGNTQYAAPVIEHSGYKPTFNLRIGNTGLKFMGHQSWDSGSYQVIWYTPGTYCTASQATGSLASWGQGSYNVRTNTLVIMHSSDVSGQMEIHRWVNPNVVLDPKERNIEQFLSQAYLGTNGASYSKSPVLNWTYGLQANSQARYANKVLALGNGKVALVRHGTNQSNSSGLYFSIFDPDTNTISNVGTSLISPQLVYGVDQGAMYGARMNFTWDNDWVAIYAPYYYYGAGMTALFIKINNITSTIPTWYTYEYNQTSYGTHIVPVRESGFLLNLTTFSPQLIDLGGLETYGRTSNGTIHGGSGSAVATTSINTFGRLAGSRMALVGMNKWVDGSMRRYK